LQILREVEVSVVGQIDAKDGHLMEDFQTDQTGAFWSSSGVARSGSLDLTP